jgi:glutamine cyclotransferase
LYESSGLYGRSALYKKDLKSGKTLQEIRLGPRFFGEGCAAVGGKIYQLTWKEQTGFVYDLNTFREIGQFTYKGEGWGLTTDGRHLIMSNGSAALTVLDPVSFRVLKTIDVRDGDRPINALNELEYIKGEIWANVFMQDVIVRISPKTGKVLGWLDMNPLYKHLDGYRDLDVLNGIAYDAKTDRIFVTGKLWPAVFEMKRP